MEDIAKKEQMAGGERITLRGRINYHGRDIMPRQALQAGQGGHHPLPRAAAHFPGKLGHGEPKDRGLPGQASAQAAETLEYVFKTLPAADQDHAPPGRLPQSGGEQQMLAIGRALMAQPKLLLLDEPLLGLSPAIQYWLAKSIKEIAEPSGGWPSSWPSSTPGPSCPSSTTATFWKTARR